MSFPFHSPRLNVFIHSHTRTSHMSIHLMWMSARHLNIKWRESVSVRVIVFCWAPFHFLCLKHVLYCRKLVVLFNASIIRTWFGVRSSFLLSTYQTASEWCDLISIYWALRNGSITHKPAIPMDNRLLSHIEISPCFVWYFFSVHTCSMYRERYVCVWVFVALYLSGARNLIEKVYNLNSLWPARERKNYRLFI